MKTFKDLLDAIAAQRHYTAEEFENIMNIVFSVAGFTMGNPGIASELGKITGYAETAEQLNTAVNAYIDSYLSARVWADKPELVSEVVWN